MPEQLAQGISAPEHASATMQDALRDFRRLAVLLRPYWRPLTNATPIGLLVGAIGLVAPLLSKLLFDRVYPTHDTTLLAVLVFGILTATVTRNLLSAFKGYYTQVVGAQVTRALSLLFFNHLQHLPIRFFDEHRVGEIVSRFQDVRSSLQLATKTLDTAFINGAYIAFIPPLLIVLNAKLALVALVTIPVISIVSTLSGRAARKIAKQTAEANAELQALQFETLSQMRALKCIAAEHQIYRSVDDQLQRALQSQVRGAFVTTAASSANAVLRAVGQCVFSWYAWRLILAGEITLGDFVAFTAYMAALSGPVTQIATFLVVFQQSAVSLRRMFEYLDAPPEQAPESAFCPLPTVTQSVVGDIEFPDVAFQYTAGCPVVHGVTLTIPAGSITAIVGQSGAGKSSLLRLICRLEEPSRGRITIGGVPIDEFSLHDLRRHMSFVWQDLGLVRGTLWENLTLGAPPVSHARVHDAVRVCRLERFVDGLSHGYQTAMGEWGTTVSGGQRQRILIARALLREAPFIFLDEATSNLDTETELEIMRDVFASRAGRTLVFVTHRMATAALADRVVVLDHGTVTAVGRYRDILETNELYRTLYGTTGSSDIDQRRLRVVRADPAGSVV